MKTPAEHSADLIASSPETTIKGPSGNRPGRPGTERVMVTITEAQADYLRAEALKESEHYPRTINAMLSIRVGEMLTGQMEQSDLDAK